MDDKSDKIFREHAAPPPAERPQEPAVPSYRKPRLVPHGQLKPAGFLLGSPPDPP